MITMEEKRAVRQAYKQGLLFMDNLSAWGEHNFITGVTKLDPVAIILQMRYPEYTFRPGAGENGREICTLTVHLKRGEPLGSTAYTIFHAIDKEVRELYGDPAYLEQLDDNPDTSWEAVQRVIKRGFNLDSCATPDEFEMELLKC